MDHITQALKKNMEYHSNECDKHKIQHVMMGERDVCPRCFLDNQDDQLQHQLEDHYKKTKRLEKYNTLYKYSLASDETIIDATLDKYIPECEEERTNKALTLECIKRFKEGQVFNIAYQGVQGTGKSHLAYSILKEMNETSDYKVSCLFISVEDMLRKIKGTFSNKDSKYTENYFVDLLSSVDYLVLDDLGAETGAIGTDKTASDFVQRVLYAITTTRQSKCTITTTNLSSKALVSIYDKKLVSRLFKNPKFIIFKDSKDKRMANIPF